MNRLSRGEVWLADFGEPVGREQGLRRPAVVFSADRINAGLGEVIVVIPVTSVGRGIPTHVEIDAPDSGLDVASYARCEDIRSIFKERLITKLGTAPPAVMFELEHVTRWVLGMA